MIFERKFKGKKFLYTKLQEKIDFFFFFKNTNSKFEVINSKFLK